LQQQQQLSKREQPDMITAVVERTMASKQFSDEELKRVFDGLKQDYGNDFVLMFLATHLETMERCAQLESRVKELEARKR
jgi:hypothetical protein